MNKGYEKFLDTIKGSVIWTESNKSASVSLSKQNNKLTIYIQIDRMGRKDKFQDVVTKCLSPILSSYANDDLEYLAKRAITQIKEGLFYKRVNLYFIVQIDINKLQMKLIEKS